MAIWGGAAGPWRSEAIGVGIEAMEIKSNGSREAKPQKNRRTENQKNGKSRRTEQQKMAMEMARIITMMVVIMVKMVSLLQRKTATSTRLMHNGKMRYCYQRMIGPHSHKKTLLSDHD